MDRIFKLEDIAQTAEDFWKAVEGKQVFAFHGEMGAGKTTFIHALCDQLGVRDVVGSPTFSLINEYRYEKDGLRKPLYHLDLYRIRDEEEAVRSGIEDVLFSGQICMAEWPEKAPGIFPPGTVHVYLQLADKGARRIKISDN